MQSFFNDYIKPSLGTVAIVLVTIFLLKKVSFTKPVANFVGL